MSSPKKPGLAKDPLKQDEGNKKSDQNEVNSTSSNGLINNNLKNGSLHEIPTKNSKSTSSKDL